MKADEVLRRYAAGERDFRRVNLRGQSFKGKDLSGSDFSEADIRGANFTKAYLKDAKFCGVKAGLQRRWQMGLTIIALLLSAVSGFFCWLPVAVVTLIFSTNDEDIVIGWVALGVIVAFWIVLIRKGINAVAFAGAVTGSGAFAGAFAVAGFGAFAVAVAGAFAGSVTGSFAVAGSLAGAFAVAGAFAFAGSLAGAFAGVFAGVFAGAGVFAFAGSVAVAVAFVLLSAYISWRTLAGDEKYTLIRTITIAFAATGGTRFRYADLTDAHFTSATLKSTDFRQANLTRTCWRNTAKLELVRPGKSYLQDAKVRQLLITGQGQDQNFDHQNLRGVNLQGANLADSNFIGADLSEANLQDADLSRAKLVQTKLDAADLTGATLTGATIEDWNITSHTQLQGVRCRYVFMHLPPKDDPNPRRKPDNWEEEFEDGDFADFIKPIVDTLDLYHNQGVDPRAIAISFKQLAENNPEAELRIAAMEARGQDNFLLRAATTPDSDHSALSAEYFTTYNQIKALSPTEVNEKLTQIDSRVSSLEITINTMQQGSSFNVENYYNLGDTMSNAPKKYTKNDFKGASFAGGFVDADTVHAHQIGGDINNYPPEQRQNLADAAAEIQQLLQQLEQTYPNATEIEKQSALAVTLQQEIKQNQTFKTRLRNALKEGGIEALKVLFAPIGIPIEMVRGWIEAEAE